MDPFPSSSEHKHRTLNSQLSVFRNILVAKSIGERQRESKNDNYGKQQEAIQLLVSLKKGHFSSVFSHDVTAAISILAKH